MKKLFVSTVVFVLAGCGGGDGAVVSNEPFCQAVLPAVDAFMARARAENPVPDDPRYGGTAVVGSIGELADGMNAAVSSDATSTQHQQFVNLMTLLDYDENAVPRPYLAESWDISDDNTSITFHLRRDVRWHDGEQTDAHDVAFTYVTVTNPLTAFPNSAFWDHYVKGAEGVEVIDDFTVRIHLRPHAEFLDPFRTLAILPEHLLGDVPPEQLKQHPYGTQCPVGNGPFVFVSHSAQDRWVFQANPAFPAGLGGRPYLDRYVYRIIPEQTTLLTELLTENIDVYVAPAPDQAQRIVDDPRTTLMRYPYRQYVFVGWNARRPQLADPRVRMAITMGTDRGRIVQALLQGYGTVANSGVPPFHWAFDEELSGSVTYDPTAARALLETAGWSDRDGDGIRENADGLPLSFSVKYNNGNQSRQDVAEIMQAQLVDIGIDARPQVVEWATLLQQINTPDLRDFDGVVMGWVVEYKLDDMDLFHSARIDQPYAWSGTSNPEIDRLLERLNSTTDRDEAITLWREYQQLVIAEQPYTFFYFPDRLDGVNVRLKGVVMDTRGDWLNIREWYLDPASR
ncbi:MAG: ABC transporter substrate-binding protein [Gemmatimonadetes bacterium]|nr:ABC transporter substrate-binding protein [Gemmatimonadota bacterium]MDA1102596.1 ABC transporter substrate-binding protein [Gemmatimonadota bacterium]